MGYEVEFLSCGSRDCGGDAIVLRFGNLLADPPQQCVVVIDGGYCENGEEIVKHITKWYKTDRVNLVISTHPDGDHCNGLSIVLEKVKTVDMLWMHQPWKHAQNIAGLFQNGQITQQGISEKLRKSLQAAKDLEKIANRRGIPIIEPFTGLKDATNHLVVCGPSQTYYESLLPQFDCFSKTSLSALMELLKVPARAVKDVLYAVTEGWNQDGIHDDPKTVSPQNNSSTVILFCPADNKHFLFTADAGIPALTQAVDALEGARYNFNQLTGVQVPHHGSRRNVGPAILNRILGPILPQPYEDKERLRTAWVSAAKDGGPKHPSRRVMNAFRRRGAPVTWATGGNTIRFNMDSPDRGWTPVAAQSFFTSVEEVDEEKTAVA